MRYPLSASLPTPDAPPSEAYAVTLPANEAAAHAPGALARLLSGKELPGCPAKCAPDRAVGTVRPSPGAGGTSRVPSFAFLLEPGRLVLTGLDGTELSRLDDLLHDEHACFSDPGSLLLSLAELRLEEDAAALTALESRLLVMEDALSGSFSRELEGTVTACRKELLRFHSYARQMAELCETLAEETPFLPEDLAGKFSRLARRFSRLYDHTLMLREYALQLMEIQKTRIDMRQNETTRILTVVTAVFLPLSLLTGWYGMNFQHMPELSSPLSYPILIGLCAGIVLLEIWYFKKKGWF